MNNDKRNLNLKLIFKLAFLLVLLLSVLSVQKYLPSPSEFDTTWMEVHLSKNNVKGNLIFILASVSLLFMGFPRQIIAFLSGYFYGFTHGLLIALFATVINCALVTLFFRVYGKYIFLKFFSKKISLINNFLDEQTIQKIIVIRLLPAGNNLVTNILAGISEVNIIKFVIGSAVGYLPQTIIFSLMGKGVLVNSEWKLAISFVLFALSLILGANLYLKNKKRSNSKLLKQEKNLQLKKVNHV